MFIYDPPKIGPGKLIYIDNENDFYSEELVGEYRLTLAFQRYIIYILMQRTATAGLHDLEKFYKRILSVGDRFLHMNGLGKLTTFKTKPTMACIILI